MTILETVFVVSSVINVFMLFLVFYMMISIIHMKTYISQIHTGLANAVGKIFIIEQLTTKMATGFTEFIQMTESMVDKFDTIGRVGQVYKTSDGRYSAKSLDELINKIRENGDETEYFSDEELKKLRNLFEQDDDFDDDEEYEN